MYQTPSNWIDITKRYFKFSAEEIRALIISVIIIAFIISFDEWGYDTFNVFIGLRNLFNALLISLLAMLVHIGVQRIAGFTLGYKIEYRMWLYGLLAGAAVCIVSKGKLWLLVPGGILFFHMAGHRLGAFRYGLNYYDIAVIGFWGPFSNLLLAMFFKFLMLYFPGNPLLQKAFIVNIWIALFSILPVPPLDGSQVFFGSKLVYAFSIGMIFGLSLALYFLPPLIAFVIGLATALITWFCFMWFFTIKKEIGGNKEW